MSPLKYVLETAKNCGKHVRYIFPGKYTLPARAENPFIMGYEAVLDTSKSLDSAESYYFQSIISVMRWMVEIVRVDIVIEVSLLSFYLAYPREGNIEADLHVIAYLKQKHNSIPVFDPTYPKIDETLSNYCDLKDFYGDAEEAIPPNAPKLCVKDVDMRAKVDSDHAGDKETRRSRTGYVIFCNVTLVDWLSNNQPTIETSVFGAGFVVLKHVMEALCGILYKLLMVCVPLSGYSYVYG